DAVGHLTLPPIPRCASSCPPQLPTTRISAVNAATRCEPQCVRWNIAQRDGLRKRRSFGYAAAGLADELFSEKHADRAPLPAQGAAWALAGAPPVRSSLVAARRSAAADPKPRPLASVGDDEDRRREVAHVAPHVRVAIGDGWRRPPHCKGSDG